MCIIVCTTYFDAQLLCKILMVILMGIETCSRIIWNIKICIYTLFELYWTIAVSCSHGHSTFEDETTLCRNVGRQYRVTRRRIPQEPTLRIQSRLIPGGWYISYFQTAAFLQVLTNSRIKWTITEQVKIEVGYMADRVVPAFRSNLFPLQRSTLVMKMSVGASEKLVRRSLVHLVAVRLNFVWWRLTFSA
jgi:hypothetical protein